MTERRLDELLWWMKSIAGKAPEEWERTFARSILRQAKRASWKPSAKQAWLMRQLVDEHLAAAEDVQLIEADP